MVPLNNIARLLSRSVVFAGRVGGGGGTHPLSLAVGVRPPIIESRQCQNGEEGGTRIAVNSRASSPSIRTQTGRSSARRGASPCQSPG